MEQGDDLPVHVGQRDQRQGQLGLVARAAEHGPRVVDERGMAQDDALWIARRAAREQDLGDRRRVGRRRQIRLAVLRSRIEAGGRQQHDRHAQGSHLFVRDAGARQNEPWARPGRDADGDVRRHPDVERDDRCAQSPGGEVGDDEPGIVGRPGHDPVAGRDAPRRHRRSCTSARGQHLAIRPSLTAAPSGDGHDGRLRRSTDGQLEQLDERLAGPPAGPRRHRPTGQMDGGTDGAGRRLWSLAGSRHGRIMDARGRRRGARSRPAAGPG